MGGLWGLVDGWRGASLSRLGDAIPIAQCILGTEYFTYRYYISDII